MDAPRIEQVDERDSSWEDHHPRFRVYLHGTGPDPSQPGWSTDTYDITGADVLQVIDWAQRTAAPEGLVYAVALVVDDAAREQLDPGRGRGLVWLVGMDGNDVPDERERVVQQRMLARRDEPVRLSAADLMPTVTDPHAG